MNPPEQDQFLQEILGNDEVERLREASLANGLRCLRRQRLRRKVERIAVAVAIPALFVVAILSQREVSRGMRISTAVAKDPHPNPLPSDGRGDQRLAVVARASDANTIPAGEGSKGTEPVKTITAEELFALLPHHTLALIGKPGHQQLICLDQPDISSGPAAEANSDR